MRLAEKREALYLKFTGVIDDISIPLNPMNGKINAVELERHLQCLANTVEANKAEMALYADQGIRNELLHLNSQLLTIISKEEMLEIDCSNSEAFKNHPLFKTIEQAKSILLKMRKDIAA